MGGDGLADTTASPCSKNDCCLYATVITEPALRLVYPERVLERDIAEAERLAAGIEPAYRVAVLVDDLDDQDRVRRLVDVAIALVDGEEPAEIVLNHFEPAAKKVEVGSGLTDELLDLTTSFDTLHDLQDRSLAAGIPATIRSQYSDDPARDFKSRAMGIDANLVLLPADAHRGQFDLDKLRRDEQFTIVVADLGTHELSVEGGDPVVALAGGDPAALEVATRIAHQQGRALEVDEGGGRRGRRGLAGTLSGVGVHATEAAGDTTVAERVAAGALVVLGHDAGSADDEAATGSVVRVYPVADDDGRTLDQLVHRYEGSQGEAIDESDRDDPGGGA